MEGAIGKVWRMVAAQGLQETMQVQKAPPVIEIELRKVALFFQTCLMAVIGLGVLREIVIGIAGTGTILQDLRHFALDAERNVGSWYEGISMAAAAAIMAFLAVLSRTSDPRNARPWTLLALVFILMSLDEIVSFHEVVVKPLRSSLHLTGIFYYSWVLLAVPMVAALAAYLVPFLLRLPRISAMRFVAAGGIFVAGAVGTELIAGYLATQGGLETPSYKFTAALQECLENIGMTYFVVSLLKHIAMVAPALTAAVGTSEAKTVSQASLLTKPQEPVAI